MQYVWWWKWVGVRGKYSRGHAFTLEHHKKYFLNNILILAYSKNNEVLHYIMTYFAII